VQVLLGSKEEFFDFKLVRYKQPWRPFPVTVADLRGQL